MGKLNIKDKTREEWLALRGEGVGGSDAATCLDLNPWKSKYSLFLEKTGKLVPEDISAKPVVEWGNRLEDVILEKFKDNHPEFFKVEKPEHMYFNDDYPYLRANLDGLCYKGDEVEGLEIKTTSVSNAEKWKDGSVPINYTLQCMHYMLVCPEIKRFHIAVLIGGSEYREITIDRDEEIIATLLQAELTFWTHVLTGTPPSLDGTASTQKALNSLYPSSNGTEIYLDEQSEVAANYESLNIACKETEDSLKELIAKRDAFKSILINALGSNERAVVGDYVVSYKTTHRKESYTKPTSFRRFTFKKIR